MREIRTSGLMSGERKRSDAHRAQATAPLLDSTKVFYSNIEFRGGLSGLRIATLKPQAA